MSDQKKPCKIKKGILKCETNNKQTNIIIIVGIILIVSAWISEIFFHYVQEFNMDTIDSETFWKFEPVEALNSTILMVIGIILVIVAVYIKIKNRSRH